MATTKGEFRPLGSFLKPCGCGRPVKYVNPSNEDKSSCNKYGRCPSYDELAETAKRYFNERNKLIAAAKTIAMFKDNTQPWEEALDYVKKMEDELYGKD